jgi:hypothetical protein
MDVDDLRDGSDAMSPCTQHVMAHDSPRLLRRSMRHAAMDSGSKLPGCGSWGSGDMATAAAAGRHGDRLSRLFMATGVGGRMPMSPRDAGNDMQIDRKTEYTESEDEVEEEEGVEAGAGLCQDDVLGLAAAASKKEQAAAAPPPPPSVCDIIDERNDGEEADGEYEEDCDTESDVFGCDAQDASVAPCSGGEPRSKQPRRRSPRNHLPGQWAIAARR